jgi:hypothetical protein
MKFLVSQKRIKLIYFEIKKQTQKILLIYLDSTFPATQEQEKNCVTNDCNGRVFVRRSFDAGVSGRNNLT